MMANTMKRQGMTTMTMTDSVHTDDTDGNDNL